MLLLPSTARNPLRATPRSEATAVTTAPIAQMPTKRPKAAPVPVGAKVAAGLSSAALMTGLLLGAAYALK